MFDFKLNNNGDIDFEETLKTNKFKVSFCMAENNMALVKFMTKTDAIQDNSGKFCISFKTELEESGQQRVLSILDNETLSQYIWIALKTELGEIEQRPEIGSSLTELTYDRPITADKLIAIQKVIETLVHDVWPEATVTTVRETGNGNMPYQNITTYIRNAAGDVVMTYVI